MTDRELLELAAKAAGHTYARWEDADNEDCAPYAVFVINEPGYCFIRWNPLTDDGDALRLAIKLNMSIIKHDAYYPYVSAEYGDKVFCSEDVFKNGGDEIKAARRAITRAAAEIGKGIK